MTSRPQTWRTTAAAIALWLAVTWPLAPLRMHGAAAPAAVALELQVPAAMTRVIGDPIPLTWRFRNQSSEPLAFLWEGCCRMNGRLDVTLGGTAIDAIPPTQALAHMFARAERLDPGQPRDFETRLRDWVALQRSGRYELRGRYTGVLPTQSPQVPPTLKLWRDSAQSEPIEIEVLSVADYWTQRQPRSRARGVALEMAGSAKIALLEPSRFIVRMTNLTDHPRALDWPEGFDVWIVDGAGRRLPGAGPVLAGRTEKIALAPQGQATRFVDIAPAHFEGEPLGMYRIFIELRETDAAARAPSEPVPARWEFAQEDVVELVREASEGPRTGLRNAALKLLRVYLGDVRPALERIEPEKLDAPSRVLLGDLRLAACLRSWLPNPGRVELSFRPAAAGWALHRPEPSACGLEESKEPAHVLEAVLGVRRHLGWEVSVRFAPDPATTLGEIERAMRVVERYRLDLADAPAALIQIDGTNAPGVVRIFAAPPPVATVLRLEGSAGQERLAQRHGNTESGFREPIEWSPVAEGREIATWIEAALNRGEILHLNCTRSARWEQIQALWRSPARRGLPLALQPE